MAMSLDELKGILKSKCEGGRLVLPVSLLKSESAAKVSSDFFPGDEIRLDLNGSESSFEESPDGQSIVIRGKGVDLPLKGMNAEARFSLNAEGAAFRIIGMGDPGWNLASSFPPFRDTLAANLRFSSAPPPRLLLYSHGEQGNEGPGMYFEGELDLSGMSAGLFDALRLPAKAPISGPVVLKNNGSKLYDIDFLSQEIEGVSLGIADNVTLTFGVRSQLGYNRRRNSHFIIPYIVLGAEISFSAQGKTHSIPVLVQATNFSSDIRFNADLTEGIDAALDEIMSLLKHAGLDGLLPKENFQIEKVLRLNEFFFDFSPEGRTKIPLIGAGVESTSSWRLLHLDASNRDLFVQRISLAFRIFDPFGSKAASLHVSGEIALGKEGKNPAVLAVNAHYPNWHIHGNLKEGTRLNLVEILKEFLGSTVAAPRMEVVGLSFELYSGNYSIDAEFEGYWPIPLGQFELAIEQVAFSVAHSAGSGTSAAAEGLFGIAGIDIRIKATHPAGADAGWEFSGSTGPGQQIAIGTLITDLAALFGDDIKKKLPPAIADLTIEDLGVTFNTKTKNFSFTCKAQFPVDSDAKVAITVTIALTHNKAVYKKDFGGQLEIKVAKDKDPLVFTLEFIEEKAEGQTADIFIATYQGGDQKLNIGDLIRAIVQGQPEWTRALDGVEIELKDALFAFSKTGEDKKFLFGLDIGAEFSLAKLPLVGKDFPPERTVGIENLQALIASKPFSAAEVKKLNELIPAGVTKLPDASKSAGAQGESQDDAQTIALKQGFNVGATLKLGDAKQNMSLPVVASATSQKDDTTGSTSAETTQATTTQATTTADNATWFKIQKSLGPIHLEQVGMQYRDAAVWFLLDAALGAAGLTLSLNGLSVHSSINKFEPQFELRGLGVDYRNEALEIGGAFLKIADREYAGAAVIKAKQLTLSALGMYKEMADGHPSMFIYAVLDYPIGGPSFFFVTGLAAGFGYNRALNMPAIDRVANFSLVENARGGAGMPKDIAAELQKMKGDITPAAGQHFLAIGLKFTSFKVVDSFALLTVSFGNHFEMNLLGLSTLVAPANAGKGTPPVAEAQLALKASFQPDKGFLGVQAQLTPNSYLLSKDCHLTGGFAFFSWFAGSEHDGDFVLTLGGYHPHFRAPAHYPTVPRLGFNWQVRPELSLKGDAYFALTASALMAGGHLEANWRSGPVHAWFKLGADFLIAWKPYHYEIDAYVALGAEVTFEFFGTQHITIDVGADLHIWGPEFTGEATIHLWIISFNISFGAGAQQRPSKIGWDEFRSSFLPENRETTGQDVKKYDVLSLAVTGGLIGKESQGKADYLGIVDPKRFSLAINTVIPVNDAKYVYKSPNGKDDKKPIETGPWSFTKCGIAPLDVKAGDLNSIQTITIRCDGATVGENIFKYQPILKKVPAALWGESLTPQLNGNQFVENALSGFEIQVAAEPAAGGSVEIEQAKLQEEDSVQEDDSGGQLSYRWESVESFAAKEFKTEKDRKDELQKAFEDGAAGRQTMLASLGFTEEEIKKIDLSKTHTKDFLIAPQIEKV